MALTQVSTGGVKDGTILNADLNASAAIAGTKISPNFGSQSVSTTGTLATGSAEVSALTVSHTNPSVTLNDTNSENDFRIKNNNGNFQIVDIDESDRLGFQFGSDGNTLLGGNVTMSGKIFLQEKIEHTGDSDTFIRFPAANEVAIQAGGTERFKVSDHVDVIGNLDVTGTITSTGNRMIISGTDPALVLTDDQSNPDYELRNQNSVFRIHDVQADTSRLVVNTDGHLDIAGNVDFGAGIDVTGNITSTGSLSITSAATTNGLVISSTNNSTRATMELNGKDSSGNQVELRLGGFGDTGRGEIFTDTNHSLGFATNNAATQMVLDTSGRLGINTISPSANLESEGNVSSTTQFSGFQG